MLSARSDEYLYNKNLLNKQLIRNMHKKNGNGMFGMLYWMRMNTMLDKILII